MKAGEEAAAKQLAAQMQGAEADQEEMEARRKQAEEMQEKKRVMIRQILEPEALERLNRVGIVKPMKQQQVEAFLLQMVQGGQVQEKISDGALVSIIEKVDAAMKPASSTIKVVRKRRDDDDDDIDLDNL
eukprot:TRINITY_DN116337_c0_g1_i1.p1 TRINITY_DN116337_c0_g1~~TRINITY_DN116337_c0_g1_i1.p1  ORF type:complete len:130 (-),score=57.99 TRINITY_DN116337_c0_g1_i1:108-497(-)